MNEIRRDVLANCEWFDTNRGFGRLTTREGDSIFVHCSQVEFGNGYLLEGLPVLCDIVPTTKGLSAMNVRLASATITPGSTVPAVPAITGGQSNGDK